MAGYGAQAAGVSPAGYGDADEAASPIGDFLTIPSTGVMSSAALIDPVKRDLVVDPTTGRTVGMNPIQQIVMLSVHTDYGSAAVRNMGNKLRTIDRITANFEQQCLSVLTDALAKPIADGFVQVLGFTSFRAGRNDGLKEGQTYGRLRWKDLTTGEEKESLV